MLVYIEIIVFILILRNKLNDSKHTSSHIVYAATEQKNICSCPSVPERASEMKEP